MVTTNSGLGSKNNQLAAQLWRQLVGAARKACSGREHDAEEVASQVLFGILSRPKDWAFALDNALTILGDGRTPGSLPPLWRRRVRSECIRYGKRRHEICMDWSNTDVEPMEKRCKETDSATTKDFLEKLSPNYQKLLLLKEEGRTQQEIASYLGVTPRTVRRWENSLREIAEKAGFQPFPKGNTY